MAAGRATWDVDWYGALWQAGALTAAKVAVDQTMAEAVNLAKRMVPVRTGTLQGSLRFQPAALEGDTMVGYWGSFDVNYAIYVEMGTIHMRARPYLLPAAQTAYLSIQPRIMAAMRSMGAL